MKTIGEKGRRKARKAKRVARAKPDPRLRPSVLPSVAIIEALTLERQRMIAGLKDLLQVYDRIIGNVRADHGWSYADVKRLAEIRQLAE